MTAQRNHRSRIYWLATLPVVTVALRGLTHPVPTLDLENTFIPNIGRLAWHGHIGDLPAYQIELWRAVPLIDGLLSSLGFRIFGDTLPAWHSVTLGFTLASTLLGMAVLLRTAGATAARLFPVLLAVSPFLLRDGLIGGLVGHSHAIAFVFAAAWLTLRAADGVAGDAPWRALGAGAVFGIGMWYERSVLAIAPALLYVIAPRGRRATIAFLAGTLVLPALMVWNTDAFIESGTRRGRAGFASMFRQAIIGISGSSEAWAATKVGDVFALGWGNILFAPPPGALGESPQQSLGTLLGHGWSLLWVGGAAGAALLLRSGRRAGALPLLLAGGYSLAYVLAPFRVEPGLFDLLRQEAPHAPTLTEARYIIPILLLWTWVAAGSLGRVADGSARGRRAVRLGTTVLVVLGAIVTVGDARSFGAPSGVYGEVLPFRYHDTYDAWDGPPAAVHLACAHPDPIERAHHHRALGQAMNLSVRFIDPTLDPGARAALDDLTIRGRLDERARRFVAHGMGIESAEAVYVLGSAGFPGLVERLRQEAESLGPSDGEAFLVGASERRKMAEVAQTVPEALRISCRPTSWGTRPLCPLIADPHALRPREGFRSAEALLRARTRRESLPAPVRAELVRGIGRVYGYTLPPSARPQVRDWATADLAMLEDGMRTGGRYRWRSVSDPRELAPWHHP